MHRMTLRDWQSCHLPEREIIGSRIKKAHSFFREQGEFVGTDRLPDSDAFIICHKNDGRAICHKTDGRTQYESWIFDEIAEKPEHRYVLAFVNSDGAFRFAGPLNPNVLGAFTCNRESNAPGVISVPLGIQDSKVSELCRARSAFMGNERTILAYLNFTYNEDPHYNRDQRLSRAIVIQHFEDLPWAKCEIRSDRRETPTEQLLYYERLSQSMFCISPEGNGIDTYRTWEALYLGAIPIVVDSIHMRSFSDLPVVYTKTYEECTRSMLEERYSDFLDRKFDFSLVMNSAYAHRVRALVDTLENPIFALYSPEFFAQWGKYFR